MFGAIGPVFYSTEGVESNFHVLRSRTRFGRYRGCRVKFSCFAFLYQFSAVPSSPDLVITYLAPRLAFGGIEGVGSSFHVLRSQTHFRRYRGRRVQFSCFALPDSFSAIPRASSPLFMFCAPRPDLSGTESDRSSFHVLRSLTRFWRYRRRRVQFSKTIF
jgi:hypothetical protein